MKKLVLALLVSSGLFIETAQAENSVECVTAPILLPLLGGQGDAPLIPVTINGKPAAMYVSPAFDYIYIRNSGDVQFPQADEDARVIINGTYQERAYHSKISELVLDGVALKDVDAVLLERPTTQSVDGRPIVGVLGRAALSRLSVLIDIPKRKFAYLEFSRDAACKGAIDTFLGEESRSLYMDDDFTVHLRIGGKKRHVSFNPDLTYTTFPSAWISSLKDSLSGLGEQKKFTHYDGFMSVGQVATVRNMTMGGLSIEDEKVLFQDDVQIGSLGLPFFENKIVLWNLRENRMYFTLSNDQPPLPKGRNLHFFSTHSGNVSVQNKRGDVE